MKNPFVNTVARIRAVFTKTSVPVTPLPEALPVESSEKRQASIKYLDHLINKISHEIFVEKPYLELYKELDANPLADFVGNVDMEYMGDFLAQAKDTYNVLEHPFHTAETEEEAKFGITNFLEIICALRDYMQYHVPSEIVVK